MMARGARRLLRLAGGFVTGLAIVAAFLVWRLSVGPVSLDYIAPAVAEAIARAEPGLVVRIDHTFLSLDRGPTLDILARGVHLGRSDGAAELVLPELSVGLSLAAAVRGEVAPTRIILRRPELRLERAADGSFRFGLAAGDAAAGTGGFSALLRTLTTPPDRQGALGYLAQVAIRDATLTVDDRGFGVRWRAERLDAAMFRGARGAFGDLAFVIAEPDGRPTELHSDFRYLPEQRRLEVELGFTELHPALFAGKTPALQTLASLDLPVSGQIRFALDTAQWRIGDAGCELTLGAGRLVNAALPGGAVPVASGKFRASYDPQQGRASIAQMLLDLGGPVATAAGTIDGLLAGGMPKALTIAADLKLSSVPVDRLPQLWPERLAPKARFWVLDHIHNGTADAAGHLGLDLDLSSDAPLPAQLSTFDGTLDYHGLTIEYFRPLPPATGVNGTARFDRANFDLSPSTGVVNGVTVTGGTVQLSQLDTHDEQIAIDLGLRGAARQVLEVLDTEPLRYPHALNIDPAAVAGEVEGRVKFAFPLKRDLDLRDVDFAAQAQLSGVALKHVVAGHDLSAGQFQLDLDRKSLRLDGTAQLDQVPAQLSWKQSLSPGDTIRARYRLRARLDDAQRERLGVNLLADALTGPVAVDASYVLSADKRAMATLALDLRDARLAIPQLNWTKPAGEPATAAAELDVIEDRVRALRQGTLKGKDADVQLSLAFDAAGAVSAATVPRLVLGQTDASGTLSQRRGGGWQIELRGASFDASGLFGGKGQGFAGKDQGSPLVIDAALDRLILGPRREARQVTAQLFSDGVHWQAASIDAALMSGGRASLRFGEAAGARPFRLSSSDFGALVALLGISDNIAGGSLDITGDAADRGADRVFRGKLDAANYRLVRAPLFARLLSVASFSGIAALLSGEGIPFTRLRAGFAIADGKVDVTGMHAYGGAIGVNAHGSYDAKAETLDVAGTLVPAYAINAVLGRVPVLGKVLLGGEGEGIFGANFKIAGPVAEPTITVNPLSALAPGVLRKLFLFSAPEP